MPSYPRKRTLNHDARLQDDADGAGFQDVKNRRSGRRPPGLRYERDNEEGGDPFFKREIKLNTGIKAYFNRQAEVDAEFADTSRSDQINGWLSMPEIPSAAEIMGLDEDGNLDEAEDEVTLQSNNIAGPWEDRDTYLRAHWHLLREDVVAPLRDAVAFMQDNPHRDEEFRVSCEIYDKVHIIGFTFSAFGIAARIRFGTKRVGKHINWEWSKRLIPGTIVALSPAEPSDEVFTKNSFVAVVANRSLDGVKQYPPEIDIFFANPNQMELDPQKEFVMVAAGHGYLEASRHTLRALQKMSTESFPLKEHLVELQENILPPEYLIRDPYINMKSCYKDPEEQAQYERVDIINGWPEPPMDLLDASQWDALKQILTNRLAIVQGPPGTGKTHVSVAALKVMLENKKPSDPPIIICAQTNHALDQILHHISVFEPNFARLGSRSDDPIVKARTLWELKKMSSMPTLPGNQFGMAKKMQEKLYQNAAEHAFEPLQRSKGTLTGELFHNLGLISTAQLESLKDGASEWIRPNQEQEQDPIQVWLGNAAQDYQVEYKQENFGFQEEEDDLEFEQRKEYEAEMGIVDEDDDDGLHGLFIAISEKYTARSNPAIEDKTLEAKLKIPDLWKVPQGVRGSLYCYLQRQAKEKLRERLVYYGHEYADLVDKVKIGRWERDAAILEAVNVIGLTTTGMSKYRPLIAALKPKIVFVEEAAEVIEAPIMVTCLESVEHLILVGDHMQLQGHCAVQELESEPYFLGVSMFERLVNNKMPFKTLMTQRRMAPEIRRLLDPIYKDLQDHQSVLERPSVPGMGPIASFFFSHEWPEATDQFNSKWNQEEAKMVEGHFLYLVHNGVAPEHITVLTFYNGQRKAILKGLKSYPELQGTYLKVVTVDSYQGDENEVVLLSLVRSNAGGEIGFLRNENRICVALSRAKRGFYIFGNSGQVAAACGLWWEVVRIMSKNPRRVGFRLPLTCQNHGQSKFVKEISDWEDNVGGCDMPCPDKLPCGHACIFKCHPRKHEDVVCAAPCRLEMPCGHFCSDYCGNQSCKCGHCEKIFSKEQVTTELSLRADDLMDEPSASVERPLHQPDPSGRGRGMPNAPPGFPSRPNEGRYTGSYQQYDNHESEPTSYAAPNIELQQRREKELRRQMKRTTLHDNRARADWENDGDDPDSASNLPPHAYIDPELDEEPAVPIGNYNYNNRNNNVRDDGWGIDTQPIHQRSTSRLSSSTVKPRPNSQQARTKPMPSNFDDGYDGTRPRTQHQQRGPPTTSSMPRNSRPGSVASASDWEQANATQGAAAAAAASAGNGGRQAVGMLPNLYS